MKKFLLTVSALYFFLPILSGQTTDEIRPPAFGISFFVNDYITPQRIRSGSLSKVLGDKQWAKFHELSPGISISYFKGLTNYIDFAATLGGSFVSIPLEDKLVNSGDHFLLEGDASLNFKMTREKYWVQPYLMAGVGGGVYKNYYSAFIPLGMGLKINVLKEASVFLTTQYRIPVTNETNAYHFMHSIGIAGRISSKKPEPLKEVVIPQSEPKDTDGDGLTDDKDKCPTIAGTTRYEGCPVPDTDKDGINDEEDKCPEIAGTARYQGCPVPDTDKDGINDEEDKCKDLPGVARYGGCPVPDADSDGINDEEDKCPNLAGVAENQGCPLISEEVKKKVDYAAKNIYFTSGSYRLLSKSYKGLNEVIKILNDNQDIKLAIDGYTDNTGTPEKNQMLSENRARAVKQYLATKGINDNRITSSGHGQDMPVADNKTAAGRAKNRRVKLKIGY